MKKIVGVSMRDNIYLGKTVRDTGKKGLDNLKEVRGIARNIVMDYMRRKISYRKAMARLNLLTLIVSRDSDFQSPRKRARAKQIIEKYRRKLKKMRR